jgi:hypothetical protein
MTGKRLKEVLEDAADNVFNPIPTISRAVTRSAVEHRPQRRAIQPVPPAGLRLGHAEVRLGFLRLTESEAPSGFGEARAWNPKAPALA